MRTVKIFSKLLAALVLTGASFTASAFNQTYTFGSLLSGSFSPSATFAQLSVSSSDDKTFTFSLSTYDLNSLFTSGAFIRTLAVDTNNKEVEGEDVSVVPGGGVKKIEPKDSAPKGWDFSFDLGQGEKDRLTANESVTWTSKLEHWNGFAGSQFALHVQGLTTVQGESGWYIPTPVPEASTLTMLLAGLGLMGMIVKHRKAG